MDRIRAKPALREFFEQHELNGLQCFTSQDRRLVLYPCREGKLLNVVAMHPSSQNPSAAESSWLAGGNLEDLLLTYSSFCEPLLEVCRMAEDLKLWSLASRTPPAKFWNERLVLIGDAAHPTLPRKNGHLL
jgi:salicylate hydroxylase